MSGNDKIVIQNDRAPRPIGPYSQAIRSGNTVYLSGQLGLDPATGELAGPDAATQTRKALEHIEAILQMADVGLPRVVKTTIYVTDLADFATINQIYAEYFNAEPPARSTVQVAALPKGACVEIEAIAVVPSASGGPLGPSLL